MTNAELNTFISRFGMELCRFYAGKKHPFQRPYPRPSGHASSPDTRNSRNSALSPNSPQTNGPLFLKNSSRLHGGVHAGGISLRINGRICCDTNRPCCITAKSRITLLYGAGYWRVAGVMQGISTRMTSLCATGSGSSSTPHGFGITVHAKTSSQNQCGGAFFSVPRSC